MQKKNLVLLDVIWVDAVTHSHMDSRGALHMSERVHLRRRPLGRLRRRRRQKLLGSFICQVKRDVVVLLALALLLYSHMQPRGIQREEGGRR